MRFGTNNRQSGYRRAGPHKHLEYCCVEIPANPFWHIYTYTGVAIAEVAVKFSCQRLGKYLLKGKYTDHSSS